MKIKNKCITKNTHSKIINVVAKIKKKNITMKRKYKET